MTTRQNTNNPCPSNALADLNDNTIIIDEWVNSKNDYTTDRFGNQFQTKHKILSDFRYSVDKIQSGSFLPISSVHTNENGIPIYRIGNQVDFNVKPKINGIEPIYIVESYQKGDSWYNVYSNGFIEQSSAIKINTPNQYAVCGTLINLLKPMKTQNYGVSIDKICGNAPWAQTEFAHAELYTTSFWLASYSSIVGECWVLWTVRGY